jgi:diaminohydroxyphosphoribosylaminopyrimidine deaminase/5-amino-6-(5-phosphoribosylamino)uracil reductase
VTKRELIKLAIAEAAKCVWTAGKEGSKPKVGAVISIDDTPIAQAHRGRDEHAEKLALADVSFDQDLSKARVLTTLGPCTPTVRREEGESCTERLIRAGIGKVVIGSLDPNQGVCGKGLLKLRSRKSKLPCPLMTWLCKSEG